MKRYVWLSVVLFACSKPGAEPADSTFAALQTRGQMAMGVDQYQNSHRFDVTDYGGRIELQSDKGDSLEIAQIRAHLRGIEHSFQAGDFTTPAFVHAHDMPGTSVLTAKRALIEYSYADLPRGGEVRLTTNDADAKKGIREFLEAQSMEHHTK